METKRNRRVRCMQWFGSDFLLGVTNWMLLQNLITLSDHRAKVSLVNLENEAVGLLKIVWSNLARNLYMPRAIADKIEAELGLHSGEFRSSADILIHLRQLFAQRRQFAEVDDRA
jgi:hypothetical protein